MSLWRGGRPRAPPSIAWPPHIVRQHLQTSAHPRSALWLRVTLSASYTSGDGVRVIFGTVPARLLGPDRDVSPGGGLSEGVRGSPRRGAAPRRKNAFINLFQKGNQPNQPEIYCFYIYQHISKLHASFISRVTSLVRVLRRQGMEQRFAKLEKRIALKGFALNQLGSKQNGKQGLPVSHHPQPADKALRLRLRHVPKSCGVQWLRSACAAWLRDRHTDYECFGADFTTFVARPSQ